MIRQAVMSKEIDRLRVQVLEKLAGTKLGVEVEIDMELVPRQNNACLNSHCLVYS